LRIAPQERGLRLLYQIGRYIADNEILGNDVAQTHFLVANNDNIEESLQHSLYYLEAARI
jgi:hypothetical protein